MDESLHGTKYDYPDAYLNWKYISFLSPPLGFRKGWAPVGIVNRVSGPLQWFGTPFCQWMAAVQWTCWTGKFLGTKHQRCMDCSLVHPASDVFAADGIDKLSVDHYTISGTCKIACWASATDEGVIFRGNKPLGLWRQESQQCVLHGQIFCHQWKKHQSLRFSQCHLLPATNIIDVNIIMIALPEGLKVRCAWIFYYLALRRFSGFKSWSLKWMSVAWRVVNKTIRLCVLASGKCNNIPYVRLLQSGDMPIPWQYLAYNSGESLP